VLPYACGRDFNSYYYALQVAKNGENPYKTKTLTRAYRVRDGRMGAVQPFFYPPPYLLSMAWAVSMDAATAYKSFYWAGAVFLISVFLALWRWLPSVWLFGASGVVLATFTPVQNTLRMGQANLLVLALLVWGVMLVEWEGANRRRYVGGALVGLACMMKMSPALVVMWWMVRREWRPVFTAIAAAVLSSLLVLPFVGFGNQVYFYLEVLPGFTSGSYHDLSVPMNIPMNHSILNFWMQVVSGFEGLEYRSSAPSSAVHLARWTAIGMLVGLLYCLRNPQPDSVSRANAAGALVVLMVITPAYSYEHHLVFLVFPILAVVAALAARRLAWYWGIVLVGVYKILAWEIRDFKQEALQQIDPAVLAEVGSRKAMYLSEAVMFRELKFLAALVLGVLCLFAAIRPALAAPSEASPALFPKLRIKRAGSQEVDSP